MARKASHKIAKDGHGLCGEHHGVRRGGLAAFFLRQQPAVPTGRKNRSAARSQEDMESVIQEEWDRLAFDRSQYDEDGFIGINALVDMWPKVLQAGVDEDGWDTRYMR